MCVDEEDGDEPLLGGDLGVVADAADVTALADGDDADSGAACFADGEIEGFEADDLAKAPAAFDDGEGVGLVHDGDVLADGDVAGLHPVDVFGDTEDAVRVVAGEVGVDEVLGDDAGFIGFDAGGDEDVMGYCGQLLG